MFVEMFVAVAVLGCLAAIAWVHEMLDGATLPRPAPELPQRYPSVSLIHPIKGLDAELAQNLEAAFEHDYPGDLERIFVFDDADEPAVPLVQAAIVGHPSAHIIYAGAPPAGRTGKLNAMIAALDEAHGELIAFVDSDTRPGPSALRMAVATLLESPRAASAFAPVVAAAPPRTIADVSYALLLNSLYGAPAAYAVHRNGGTLPFIMGQFMVWRREAIAAIGGLECAEGQLVDDMYLGQRAHAAGWENRVSTEVVPIVEGGMGLSEFAGVYLRWIAFSRTGLAGWTVKRFAWFQATMVWLGTLLVLTCLASGLFVAGSLAALLPLAVIASINRLHEAVGGAPLRYRHAWVAFALIIVSPLVFAALHMRHEITWRGRTYPLDRGSRLARQH